MAFSTQWGNNPNMFGGADYAAALDPHKSDTEKLKQTRQSVLAWLTGEGSSKLASNNQPGQPGGLYDWIQNPTIHERWGDATLEGRTEFFGAADLDASRAGGFTDPQILEWLQSNLTKVRGPNIPGGGDIYDWLSGTASEDDRPDRNPNITQPEDPYVPGDSRSPSVTRRDSNYVGFDGLTINRPSRDSLKIKPGGNMLPKNARSLSSPKRKKYEQTTDLARQARNSLNIS